MALQVGMEVHFTYKGKQVMGQIVSLGRIKGASSPDIEIEIEYEGRSLRLIREISDQQIEKWSVGDLERALSGSDLCK